MFGLGVVGEAIAGQRVIAQRTFERVRRLELEAGIQPSHYEPARPAVDADAEDGSLHDRARDNQTSEVGGDRGGDVAADCGGNVYDKYGSSNPVERRLVRRFCDELERLAIGTGAREVHEVGCGEGELLLRLAKRGMRARGTDISDSVIDEARGRAAGRRLEVSFRAAPIEALTPAGTQPNWSSAAR